MSRTILIVGDEQAVVIQQDHIEAPFGEPQPGLRHGSSFRDPVRLTCGIAQSGVVWHPWQVTPVMALVAPVSAEDMATPGSGGGISYWFRERMGVRVEYRHYWSEVLGNYPMVLVGVHWR